MDQMPRYPIKLRPYVSETLWGGRRLAEEYGIALGQKANCAEAWVFSAHPRGASVVEGGLYDRMPLNDLFAQQPALFGTKAQGLPALPVLVKLIDAMEDLSVQVHPADGDAGLRPGEAGKTECWYILDAKPGARLLLGLRRTVTKEEFARAVAQGSVTELLETVEVKAGSFFFIPAGTLHAIGKGVLLAEVQQNSDTTYRVYDYNRLQNGRPRALHLDKALAVAKLEPYKGESPSPRTDGAAKRRLLACPLFTVEEWIFSGGLEGSAGEESFLSLLVLEGGGSLCASGEALALGKGESVLLPAGSGAFCLRGDMRLLVTSL
jgi:mannose-6-phosphate isomerase